MSQLTAEAIVSAWRPDDPRVSPDGRLIAWSAAPYGKPGEHGESAIWVAPADGSLPARRWTWGGDDRNPRWSPDGRRLAFRSDREKRGTHGLYLLPVDGGEAAPLVIRERSVDAFCWSPDGSRIAFCAADEPDDEDKRRDEERDDPDVYAESWQFARLRVVDVETGDLSTLVGDDRHVVSAAWSPDGSVIAFTAQQNPDPDEVMRRSLWVVDAGGGEPRRLVEGPQLEDLTWLPDGSALAYVTSHDPVPQSSFSVWVAGLGGGDQPRCVGTQRDEGACSVGVRALDDGRLAVLVLEGLASRLDLAPSTGAGATGDAATPGAARTPWWEADGDVSAFDSAGGTLAAVTAGGRGPHEVWAGAPGRMRQLSDHHSDWARIEFGAVEDFEYEASDGLALDAVLIRPPGGGGSPNATVVLVHGGPYGRSGRSLHCGALDWGQWLATAGYTVLLPNYRGGIGHGDDFAAAVRGDMGGAEWGDVLAAVDAAVGRGIADPDRLGIGGWSQGGFLTAWAVTQTDRFKAGVMGAGVSDWGAMAAISDLPTFEAALGGDTPWDGPGPHRAVQRSPISYASRRRTPLLILHGQKDLRVPIGQATAFHRALRGQDVPVEMVTYPREPHGVAERAHQIDVLRRVRAWYDRWLRAN